MDFLIALFVFPISFLGLIFAANYLLSSSKEMGLALGLSPFVVGSFIIAFGTSLPELAISVFSTINGLVDVPISQTIGSNIANVLFVLGISAIVSAKGLSVTKNLIDVELPLLVLITTIFIFSVLDGNIVASEGILLLIGFVFYLLYIFKEQDNRITITTPQEQLGKISHFPKNAFIFLFSALLIAVSSNFLVESTSAIALFFEVPTALIAFSAIALGTSLPELVVSIKAGLRNEVELIIGNMIGSNIFNILFVLGVPSLITTLTLASDTIFINISLLVATTVIFVISGISNKIHKWEGMFYVLLYFLLIGKILGIL